MRPDRADAGVLDGDLRQLRGVVTAEDERVRQLVSGGDAEGNVDRLPVVNVQHLGHPVLVYEEQRISPVTIITVAGGVFIALDARGDDAPVRPLNELLGVGAAAPVEEQAVAVHVRLERFRVGDDGGADAQAVVAPALIGQADNDFTGPVVGGLQEGRQAGE